MAPNEHNSCQTREEQFLQRLRSRLAAAPVFSLDEQVQTTVDVIESVAEDPLVVSMHLGEVLPAYSRHNFARSLDGRETLPVTMSCSEYLFSSKVER